MASSDFVPAPDAPVLWTARRPPSAGVRALSWIVGAAFAAGAAWLFREIQAGAGWGLSIAVGSAFGLLIPLAMRSGAVIRIHADGRLAYGFGRHPNLVLPLRAVREATWVEVGTLRGIGLRIDPEEVRFIHRKGISYATMRRYREASGMDLVLEFLTPDDLERLRDLRSRMSEAA